MTDITTIPIAELKEDLAASMIDLRAQEKRYVVNKDSRLEEWIEHNRAIISVIQEELKRRGA